MFGGGTLELGPWEDVWTRQVRREGPPIEASDALAGVDVLAFLVGGGVEVVRKERWIWPLAAGQRHVVEALAFRRPG